MSYYALFRYVSKPTSWLSATPRPFPLSARRVWLMITGCFPLDYKLIPPQSHCAPTPIGIRSLADVSNQAHRPSMATSNRNHNAAPVGEPAITEFDYISLPTAHPQVSTLVVQSSTKSCFNLAMVRSPRFGSERATNALLVLSRYGYPTRVNLATRH